MVICLMYVAGSVGVVEEEGIKAKKTAKSGSLSTV